MAKGFGVSSLTNTIHYGTQNKKICLLVKFRIVGIVVQR